MTTKDNTINIKAVPVKGQIGVTKFYNNDWTTEAFLIPRSCILSKLTEEELLYNGIYFLVGTEGETEKIYVGQGKKGNKGDSILRRLKQHKESKTEPYRDIWNYIVVVTASNDTWNEGEVSTIERIFCNLIPEKNNLNGNEPRGDLSINCDDKVEHIKAYLMAIGISTFSEKTEPISVQEVVEESKIVERINNSLSCIPEIITPYKTVKQMVDMLSPDVWNKDTKFLDPICKGGEFLREIYDRLMKTDSLKAHFPDVIERSNHILSEQLYGIALSQTSYERTKNKLLGFGHNIRIIPGYINILKDVSLKKKNKDNRTEAEKQAERQNNTRNIRQRIMTEFKETEEMKIDVVIGNPPYQENSKSIYTYFIDLGIALAEKQVCMITKNNWLNSDTLCESRKNMIDAGLKEVINYPEIGEVFNGVSPSVTIINIDKTAEYKGTNYLEIRNKEAVSEYTEDLRDVPVIFTNTTEFSIYSKISKTLKDNHFGVRTYPAECFRINSNGTSGRGLNTSIVNDYDTKSDEHNVMVVYMSESKQPFARWISINDIPSRKELVGKYKVICGCVISNDDNVIRNVRVVAPMSVLSKSWGLLYTCDTEEEALNVAQYVKTKTFRFLVKLLVSSLNNCLSAYRFSLVPLQDFNTTDADIDWNQSVSEIDKQLYEKYNLTPDEIEYIESTIISMDSSLQSETQKESKTIQPVKKKLTIQDAEAAYINNMLKQQ